MKIIPAVDIINGKTVRLEEGDYNRKLSYDIDPVEAALKWEKMGAEILHIIDLDGAREGKPVNLDITEKIVKAVKVPVQTGGGFRTESEIEDALSRGVWRVILGSRALEDMDFTKGVIEKFGDKVIFSIDAKNLEVRTEGWEKGAGLNLFDVVKKFAALGVAEIIFTDIRKDGTLQGPSIDLLRELLQEANMNVISAGGVKTVQDIKDLKELEDIGLSGAIIGRALYDGTIDLSEAIDVS